MNIYVYHHLGLGDHIICNGLVRNFCRNYNYIYLFCYKKNEKNVRYMYRDLKNLILMVVNSDSEADLIIKKNNLNVVKIGFDRLNPLGINTFDFQFYEMCNLPFSCKFEDFYLKRDIKKEFSILNDLNPKKEPYIFINENLDLNKIRKDLKIIVNPIQYNLFNLISLFENAEEIHVSESSIKCLINQFKLNKPKLYYHNYVKYCHKFYNSKGLNIFETIS